MLSTRVDSLPSTFWTEVKIREKRDNDHPVVSRRGKDGRTERCESVVDLAIPELDVHRSTLILEHLDLAVDTPQIGFESVQDVFHPCEDGITVLDLGMELSDVLCIVQIYTFPRKKR